MNNKLLKFRNYLLVISLFVGLQSCGSVKSSFDYDKVLWTSSWSPKGDLIAVGGNRNELQIFSSKNLELVKTYDIANTITNIKWSGLNNLMAVTTHISEESCVLLNTKTDGKINLDGISKDGARGLSWNFDESLLGVGDNDGILTVFDVNGDLVKKIDLEQKSITAISWHPSKNILVAVGNQISIYDLDKEELKSIKPRKEEILMLCVEWHISGQFFVTGDYGDKNNNYPPLLQYWKATGKHLKDIRKSKTEFRNMSWSSDGKVLATVSDKLRLWSPEGKLLKSRSFKTLLWGVDWKLDNSKLVVTSEKGDIVILDHNLDLIVKGI